MGFASFMILIWDHIITIGDEVRDHFGVGSGVQYIYANRGFWKVEYIWKGKKGVCEHICTPS